MNRKLVAIVLAFALLFSTMTTAFAQDNAAAISADAQAMATIGMLQGTNGTVDAAYTATQPTRLQAAIMMLRLKGLEAEALAFTGTANFADGNIQWAGGKAIMAYLKAHPELGWIGVDGKFMPNDKITAQQYYKVMLESLGYKQNTAEVVGDFDYAGIINFAATKGLVKVAAVSNFSVNDLAIATVEALKANVKGGTGTLAAALVAAGKLDSAKAATAGIISGSASVASVTANSAKSFLVKFNAAVADTAKVTFEVKRLTTAVTMTASWNADKTEATLANTANLPEGSYTIVVKNDGAELTSKTVAISSAQKIGKIEVTSDKLAITSDGKGYATYKVYDQYNNDITSTYLANNINFQTGVGTVTASKGLLTVEPATGINLIMFSTVVVSGYETTSGVSVTKSLTTSTALGTLSDIKLGSLENVKLVASDVTSVYYIPFTAYDMSGNETKNFDLIAGGLITTSNKLSVSNPNVQAQIVRDPANSKNAAIELKVISTSNVVMNMPVTITAMTFNGKVSTVDTTLIKADALDTFTLMLPDNNIASNEIKEIPFVAYDQSGNKITKYSDLDSSRVTFTPAGSPSTDGLYLVKDVDGSAKVMYNAPTTSTTSVTSILTAVVSATGKLSTVNLTIQKPAVPSELALDPSVLVSAMENGATQTLDFGYDNGGLVVNDQYGRDADFYHAANGGYFVTIESSNNAVVDLISGADTDVTAHVATVHPNTESNAILSAVAANGGSATITAKLYGPDGSDADSNPDLIDTQSVALSVIKTDDIKGFTMTTATAPIYAAADRATGADTAQEMAWAQQFKVYGKTAAGAKVMLAGTPVLSAAVDNTSDFAVTSGTTGGAYDVAKVTAIVPADPAKTGATTNVTVNVFHNNTVTPVTTTLTSSTTAPKATGIEVVVSDYNGVTVDSDEVTVQTSTFASGDILQKYNADGTNTPNADAYFRVVDSYGKNGMLFRDFKLVDSNITTGTVSINSAGVLTISNAPLASGDDFTISAITSNGLVKTIKFIVE